MHDHIHDHCEHPVCGDGLFCCHCSQEVLTLTEQRLRDLVEASVAVFSSKRRSVLDTYSTALTAAREHLDGSAEPCDREDIGNDCRCDACEMRKVEAAEAAQEASEGR